MPGWSFILACIVAAPIPNRPADRFGDPLPDGAVSRIGTLRLRGALLRPTFSPDGKLLATADDGPIRLWNAKTGAHQAEIGLPDNELATTFRRPETVALMAFSDDSGELRVMSRSGFLRTYDLGEGKWSKVLARTETPAYRLGEFASGRVSPDRTLFFLNRYDVGSNAIEVFQIGKDRPIFQIADPKFGAFGRVPSVTADSSRAAVALNDGTVKLWDLKPLKPVETFSAPEGIIQGFSLAPDGGTLAMVCGPRDERKSRVDEFYLSCRDLKTGREQFRISRWPSRWADFSPDGTKLVGVMAREILVVDAKTGKLLHQLRNEAVLMASFSAFSADGKRLIVSYHDSTATVWDLETGKAILDFDSPRGRLDVVAFSPDGRTIVTGASGDHSAMLWDAETGRLLHRLVADRKRGPLCAEFTRDGAHVIVGYGSGGTGTGNAWPARVWSVNDGKLVREIGAHENGVSRISLSPDRKTFATWDREENLRVWEIGTGKQVREFKVADHPRSHSIGYRSKGELLGMTIAENFDRFYVDLLTNVRLGHHTSGKAWEVAFSADGRMVATADFNDPPHAASQRDSPASHRRRKVAMLDPRTRGVVFNSSRLLSGWAKAGRVRHGSHPPAGFGSDLQHDDR